MGWLVAGRAYRSQHRGLLGSGAGSAGLWRGVPGPKGTESAGP